MSILKRLNIFRIMHRAFVFHQAMKVFLKEIQLDRPIEKKLIADLVYGWGNKWSAQYEYLSDSINHALLSRGAILECGSGLSTLLIGAIAKKTGQTLWTLEHKSEWAIKVQKYLKKYALDSVVLYSKPLKEYENFYWYDAPLESMPDSFSLVICDGPPGKTKGGRYGLVPILKDRLKPGCTILLDDAGREQERSIANRWQSELNSSYTILGVKKPYIKIFVN